MHIGINYTAALRQQAGIGRYTRGLVNALAELDRENQYTLIITADSPGHKGLLLPDNFRLKVLPISERRLTILWHRLYLPLAVDTWAGPFDLFHSPDFVLPPLHRAAGLLTVHDLSFMIHPDGAVPGLRNWLNRVVPRSVKRASHILADSHSTKRDLETQLAVSPERITVVGAGVEPRFRPITNEQELTQVRRKYNLPDQFILSLGTLEPRKNFTGLIQAFNQLQGTFPALHLVIGGSKGWLYEPIFAAAAQSPAADRIHFPGFIADDDLATLYSLADIFAFPSHYEGFGIPILEAMACGTPVISADNSSLPEVAGGAALLVPATDTAALTDAIHRLCTTPSLREQCVRLGLAQPAKFTWQTAAEKLLAAYNAFSNPNPSDKRPRFP